MVTIFDSSDLAFAIQCSRTLKLTLLVNEPEKVTDNKLSTDIPDLMLIRTELATIRDRANILLDLLGSATTTSKVTEISPLAEMEKPAAVHPKEFDPFQQTVAKDDKVSAAFGLPELQSSEGTAASSLPNAVIQPTVATPTLSVQPQVSNSSQQHQAMVNGMTHPQMGSQYPGYSQQQAGQQHQGMFKYLFNLES